MDKLNVAAGLICGESGMWHWLQVLSCGRPHGRRAVTPNANKNGQEGVQTTYCLRSSFTDASLWEDPNKGWQNAVLHFMIAFWYQLILCTLFICR